MVRMGGALLRLYSPGALAMPAQVKQATPRTRLRAGNFQFQGSGDCAGAFASGKTPGPSFTGSVILAGKCLELTEQDIEPAAGSVAEILLAMMPSKSDRLSLTPRTLAPLAATAAKAV
jgi:hypothetical protein